MNSNSSNSSKFLQQQQHHLQMMQHHHQQQQQHSLPASMAAALVHGIGMQVHAAQPPPIATSTPSSSAAVSDSQQQQSAATLQGPPPTWAYAHPALMPLDPQTESLAENWRQFQQAAYNYNLDPHLLAIYGGSFAAGRADLAGQRRKNATRETTGVLKAWLNEHKKNPYPTKGEKIMLAIITTMTLTQVSTWFANARRRLKKENKMTWAPRNRGDDAHSSGGGGAGSSDNHTFDQEEDDVDVNDRDIADDNDDDNPADEPGGRARAAEFDRRAGDNLKRRAAFEVAAAEAADTLTEKRERLEETQKSQQAAVDKPRIWSIVDTATKVEAPRPSTTSANSMAAAAAAAAAATNAWIGGAKFNGLFFPPHTSLFPGMGQQLPPPPPSMLAFQPPQHQPHHQHPFVQHHAARSFVDFAAMSAAFARPPQLPQLPMQLHHHSLSPGGSPTQIPESSIL